MIVKDEAKNLPRCLNSVADVVDEIIVVDTGSTDKTVEIAKGFRAKVYHHPWEGSFSKARNYSLKYAACEWILILDADEELEKDDASRLKEIAKDNNHTAVSFVIKNRFKDSTQESYANMIRLFRNFNGVYYEGNVHNTIQCGGTCLNSSLSVIHHGYNLSEKEMEEKFLRTTTLLKEQIKTEPDNPIPHMYLGISYMGHGRYDEAIVESKMSLKLAEETGHVAKDLFVSYYIISASYFEKGILKEAEAYALKQIEMDSLSLDGYCILSFIYHNLEKYERFLANSEKYLTLWDRITKHPEMANTSISHTVGHKWKIHLLRGFYYLSHNQDERGNSEIDVAVRESTEIEKCLGLLGNFYLKNNCLDKAESVFRKILNINAHAVDAMVRTGHIKFRKGELKETIYFWKKAVDVEPTLFDIRLLTCRVHIAQGNIEEVITECGQLLQLLDINRNVVVESFSDMANLFNKIGEKLRDKHDLQSSETALNLCRDLEHLQSESSKLLTDNILS